jgi:hypothetical protein
MKKKWRCVMVDMREIIAGQMEEMRNRITQYAGSDVAGEFFKDSEKAAESTSPVDNAIWMKGAIDRLDALTDEVTRRKIMGDCGRHCQSIFRKEMDEARERRLKYNTEEEFLEDELNPPPGTGVRFERDGDIIHNYYTPRQYGDGMRCYCYLIGALPDDIKASPTYCQCSRAWQKNYWEGALGRPVRVELAETTISSDSDECHFIVYLK